MAMTQRLNYLETINEKIGDGEDVLRIALDVGRIGIWEWNLKTQNLRWDSRMHQIFGTNSLIFTGKANFFFNNLLEEDKPLVSKAVTIAINTGEPYEYKFHFVSPVDGEPREILARGKVLRNTFGEAIKMVGACIACPKTP